MKLRDSSAVCSDSDCNFSWFCDEQGRALTLTYNHSPKCEATDESVPQSFKAYNFANRKVDAERVGEKMLNVAL